MPPITRQIGRLNLANSNLQHGTIEEKNNTTHTGPSGRSRSIPVPKTKSEASSSDGVSRVLGALPESSSVKTISHSRNLSATKPMTQSLRTLSNTTSKSTLKPATLSPQGELISGPIQKPDETSAQSRHSRIKSETSIPTLTSASRLPTASSKTIPHRKVASSNPHQQPVASKLKQTTLSAKASIPSSTDAIHEAHDPSFKTCIQDELLQLSLVYRHSKENLQAFEKSAQRKIRHCLQELQSQTTQLSGMEQQHQEHINTTAILQWVELDKVPLGEHRVLSLSTCIKEVSDLVTQQAEFEQCMQEFDNWQGRAVSTMRSQTDPGFVIDPGVPMLVNPLSRTWLDNVQQLRSKLQRCQHALTNVGNANDHSALALTIERHHTLISTMLEEIQISLSIHNRILKQQHQWTSHTISNVISGVRASEETTNSNDRIGIWETLIAR